MAAKNHSPDPWTSGDAYEAFMGRWSRNLASAFLDWLAPEPGLAWLDVGCGTGALTAAILRSAAPDRVVGCDPAEAFIDYARGTVQAPAVQFEVAGIDRLPAIDPGFDFVVSSLVLNFLPSTPAALQAMAKAARPGGRIAACVWDYAGGMEFLRAFWDAAAALDPDAAAHDEGLRFPLCREGALEDAFTRAGLTQVRAGSISTPTVFRDFADYWEPFERGTGPAAGYVAGLAAEKKARLKERLRAQFAPAGDGPIRLSARAWAACGKTGGF